MHSADTQLLCVSQFCGKFNEHTEHIHQYLTDVQIKNLNRKITSFGEDVRLDLIFITDGRYKIYRISGKVYPDFQGVLCVDKRAQWRLMPTGNDGHRRWFTLL